VAEGLDRSRRSLSVRGYLVLLVLSIVLPGSIFAGILFWRYYDAQLKRIEQVLQNDARQLALSVDRDLAGLQSTLQTLALSVRIVNRDYDGFYQQASQVRDVIGVNILLRDVNGQQLANTRVPWGSPLPREPLDGDRDVIKTKEPAVTGVIVGAVAQHPEITITAPVVNKGRVTHLLNLSLETERFAGLLGRSLETGQQAGILDRNGVVLARTSSGGESVGEPASPSLLSQMQGQEGTLRGLIRDDQEVRGAYVQSKLAGWMVWVGVPAETVRSSLRNAFFALATLGTVLALAAFSLAYAVGGQIAGSIRSLAAQATALGRGEPVSAQRLAVRELNEVGAELVAASITSRDRERERDQAEQGLRALSETLEKKVSVRTEALVEEMQRRIEAEEVLRQAQKMEAIGQLTGGVAHDFNNMLAVIMGGLDLALRRLAKGDTSVDKYLTNAQEGTRRAAALTQRLLAFARQQPLEPEPVEASKLIAGMSDLLRRSLGETIKLETVLDGDIRRTHVDRNQLENAILNLAVNARDAMPRGGKLTIEASNADIGNKRTAGRAGVPVGQYVLIAVTDTGSGMPPEVIAKAFDPFFTTKKSGAGTGLGLSQVYGFVTQSGGQVKIHSEVGKGTTIKIYLPCYFGDAAPREDAADKAPIPTNDGSITVLVVEDEDAVRAHATEALQELGYRVLQAGAAAAALRTIDDHPEIGLLFTDVVMPDMNGRRLSEEALRRRPALKVLFTTGYTRDAIVHDGMLDPDVELLRKPFTLEQLARKVAEVLKS
jgi:signal transduction histidine kinase